MKPNISRGEQFSARVRWRIRWHVSGNFGRQRDHKLLESCLVVTHIPTNKLTSSLEKGVDIWMMRLTSLHQGIKSKHLQEKSPGQKKIP